MQSRYHPKILKQEALRNLRIIYNNTRLHATHVNPGLISVTG